MTDELLEFAAKAHGGLVFVRNMGWIYESANGTRGAWWNPLGSNSDCFALIAKFRLGIAFEKLHTVSVWCDPLDGWITEHCKDGMGADIEDKIRLCVLRVVAEIGRAMA